MEHLRFVVLFGRNNQHENTEKCMFYCITFHNFLNKDQGVLTDPKRIKVLPEWPTPPSIRKIWDFHDLTNFYKRFVTYFSILVAPLIKLVRKHVPSWEDAQERGFQTLPYFNIPNSTNIYVFILFYRCWVKKHRASRTSGFEVKSFSRGREWCNTTPKGHWIEDSNKIEPKMQEKTLGLSWALG